jgi:hypothetical protein
MGSYISEGDILHLDSCRGVYSNRGAYEIDPVLNLATRREQML